MDENLERAIPAEEERAEKPNEAKQRVVEANQGKIRGSLAAGMASIYLAPRGGSRSQSVSLR